MPPSSTCSPAPRPLKFQPRLLRARILGAPSLARLFLRQGRDSTTNALPKGSCMSLPRPLPSPTGISTPRCAKTASFRRRRSSAPRPTSRASQSTKPSTSNPSKTPKNSGPAWRSELHWFKPWDKVLEWNLPWAKWFVGGKINLSYNCVDRHALGERAQKTALIWEGEPGEIRRLTYAELHAEVQKFANALKSLGIQKGDRVAVYMGMTPELAIALLACARIGAVHSVIFGGFAANAIADRVNDSGCVAIITQDTSYRRGNEIKLKRTVDEAMPACPTVKHVVVYRRTGSPVNMVEGRDHWWHDLVAKAAPECPAEPMDSEDPLYILYTSGIDRQAQGPAAHHRRLRRANLPHHQVRLRPARRRHLLVHGRYRLGHRPLLRCLRPAAERRHRADVRGRAQLARLFALLEDRRRPSRHRLLHRAHRHPRLHQVGRRIRRQVQARLAAPARHRRRAHQPRSVDVVPREDRPQPLPHRRYLVAD